jgi:UDP:flavonoid glycosyltransferase YjiC (YdhE family)
VQVVQSIRAQSWATFGAKPLLAATLGRRILAPQYVTRAREIATRITGPAASVANAADLMEDFARLRRFG